MQDKREQIRALLSKYYLTHTWLVNELEKRQVLVSASELCDILNCRRRGKKAAVTIDTSIEILERYGHFYAGA